MEPKHQASIFVCARWETRYITEWLLYHRSIGFDHVYLYCNDDDPLDLYGEVRPFCEGPAPFVTFRHFPFQGQQFYMLRHALRHYRHETEWIAFLDIDEFLLLHGTNDVKAFLKRFPDKWSAIHLNWSFFGNSFHEERPRGGVLRTYTLREEQLHHAYKTITRASRVDDLERVMDKVQFWHSWNGAVGPDFRACNVVGDPIEDVMGTDGGVAYLRPKEVQSRIRGVAVINHYAFKSRADFELRYQRGIYGDFAGQAHWKQQLDEGALDDYLRSLNTVTDTYLADYWTRYLRDCEATRIVPPARLPNIAIGKTASQSSHSPWSIGATIEEDAGGVVNGRITGGAQCHTLVEDQPWWMLDLGEPHLVYEIRVFNRVDLPSMRLRLGACRIEIAGETQEWRTLFETDGHVLIGGADGEPLILTQPNAAIVRYVRVQVLGHTCLHLDQVEVYGVPLR